MTDDMEFEQFVKQNRDLIERMIALQKGAASDFIGVERGIAMDAYSQARGMADYGRARTEDIMHAAYSTMMDPEVQRHFMNMGMEFFMGMSALMQRAPMPGAVRDGLATTRANWNNVHTGTQAEQPRGPQRVNISTDEESRRDVPNDVFKECSE